MKRLLWLLATLLFATVAHASVANLYLAATSAGSGDGSSCANAKAYSFFNTSGNWGSGGAQIGPGSTVHICGTITVAQNTEVLIFQGSGTSGNPITLYFESGAVLSSPAWPADGSGGAIDTAGNSYITINGNGGASGATQGIIEATLNGDTGATCLGGTCTHHGDSNGIEANGTQHFVMEGLSIIDMYVTLGNSTSANANPGGGTCVYDHGQIVDWTVENNFMHDVGWCVSLQFDSGASSNLTISGNDIYNIDHGIAIGGPHASMSLTGVDVHGNNIHDYSGWDTTTDTWHHDGIHIWGDNDDGSDPISDVSIYSNTFGGCIGQNVTAHIFIEQNAGNTTGVTIYNNTLIDTCSGNDTDGMLTTGVDSGAKVLNNTFLGAPTDICSGTSSSPSVTFINNVLSGCGTLQYIATGGGFAASSLHNNIYANCSGSNCFAYRGAFSGAFSSWQSETGQDASPSEYVASANLTSAGVPNSGSAVIGNGANLTSLGITGLDSDLVGVARPPTGAWDVGAYQYASGAVSLTSITVSAASLVQYATRQAAAECFYSDSSSDDCTTTDPRGNVCGSWASSQAGSSITSGGLLTAILVGSTNVSCSIGAISSNSLSVSVTADGFPIPPGGATLYPNLQTTSPTIWNGCDPPSCSGTNPGTTGTYSLTTVSTPSLSGTALDQFQDATNCATGASPGCFYNTLWSYKPGCPGACTAVTGEIVSRYFEVTSLANVQQLEFDPGLYDGNYLYQASVACRLVGTGSGFWFFWDAANQMWEPTTFACDATTIAPNVWHYPQLGISIDSFHGAYTLSAFWYDGKEVCTNCATYFAYLYNAGPPTGGSVMSEQQIDGTVTTGAATEYLDDYNFWAWGAAPNPPTLLPGAIVEGTTIQ